MIHLAGPAVILGSTIWLVCALGNYIAHFRFVASDIIAHRNLAINLHHGEPDLNMPVVHGR